MSKVMNVSERTLNQLAPCYHGPEENDRWGGANGENTKPNVKTAKEILMRA
jgi:hypothetical protein